MYFYFLLIFITISYNSLFGSEGLDYKVTLPSGYEAQVKIFKLPNPSIEKISDYRNRLLDQLNKPVGPDEEFFTESQINAIINEFLIFNGFMSRSENDDR